MTYSFKDYEFNKVLDEFQKKVNSGEFKKKIPYKDWKVLRNLKNIRVYCNTFRSPNLDRVDLSICNGPFAYDDRFTDNGFADFFCKYIHEKENTKVLSSELKNPEGYIYFESNGSEYKIPVSNFTIDISYDGETAITAKGTYSDKVVKIKNEKETTLTCDNATINSTVFDNLWKYDYDYGSTACNCATATSKTQNDWFNEYINTSSNTSKVSGIPLTTDRTILIDKGDISVNCDVYSLTDRINDLEKSIDNLKNNDKNKENKNMTGMKFDFGPVNNSAVRMSMYGMAVMNAAKEWVSYDRKTNQIINVDILNFPNGGKYFYKVPAPIKDVKVGDVIIHMGRPVFVNAINDGTFTVIDPTNSEVKVVLAVKNMFGFDFLIKVVCLMDMFGATPSADLPFGNMLPFMVMNDEKNDMNDALMMMMLMNGKSDFANNPMLMYLMLSNKGKDSAIDPLMMAFMMNGGNCFCGNAVPAPADPNTCDGK